jgi:hypothetical protein
VGYLAGQAKLLAAVYRLLLLLLVVGVGVAAPRFLQ